MQCRLSVVSLLCALAATSASAATIVSVSGTPAVFIGTAVTAAGWTQTSAYTNVNVSAVLTNASGIGAGLAMHAFLTNAIGAGTTVANEIASVGFNLTPGIAQNVSLFSGLSLGPGNYFLVLQPDGGSTGQGGWAAAVPTIVTDGGVTRVGDRFSSTAAGYAPASTLNLINQSQQLLYSVETANSAVPEPSTAALVAAGLGIAMARRRWRRG